MRGDGEVTAANAEVTVGTDTFAAVVGSGQGNSEVTARDVDVGVALDGRTVGRFILVVDRLQDGAALRSDVDSAARNIDVTVSLDAFRHVTGVDDSERSAININKTIGLDALAVRAACVEGERAVVHGENARHLDASLAFCSSIDGEVTALDRDITRNVKAI